MKKYKIGSKGVVWGTRDPLLEFLDPLINISGTFKVRNFKFGATMDGSEYLRKMQN